MRAAGQHPAFLVVLALHREIPTVGDQSMPCYVPGQITGQENCGAGDILWGAITAHGDMREQLCEALRALDQLLADRCADYAGADGVHADPVRRKFVRQRHGEALHSML